MVRSRSLRVRAAAAAAAMLLCVVGCTANGDDETDGGETTDPSASATTPPSGAPDLSFDGDPSGRGGVASVEWSDPFALDSRFAVVRADGGDGSWSYSDTATDCVLFFFQGATGDLDVGVDDRTSSDAMLLNIIGANNPDVTADVISQYTLDATVPVVGSEALVDMRQFGGQSADGASQVDAARHIAGLDSGLYVSITCPAGEQDAFGEFDELVAAGLLAVAVESAG